MILGIADPDDFSEIEYIGEQCLPIYYKEKDLIDIKNKENYYIFKVHDNTRIYGFMVTKKQDQNNNLHIMSISILPKYRGNNLGSNMIHKLKEMFPYYTITLYVQTQNNRAIRFYKKNGFIILNELNNYYSNQENNNAYKMIFYSNH